MGIFYVAFLMLITVLVALVIRLVLEEPSPMETSAVAARCQAIVACLRSPVGIILATVALAAWPLVVFRVVGYLTTHGIRAEATTDVLMPTLLCVGGVFGVLAWCVCRSHMSAECRLLRVANKLCVIVIFANVISSEMILGGLVFGLSQIAMLLPAIMYCVAVIYALLRLRRTTRKRSLWKHTAWVAFLTLTIYVYWMLGWGFGVEIAWCQTHYGDFVPTPCQMQESGQRFPIPFAPFL